MAQGRVDITVSVEVDTGDDTPMEAVLDELAHSHVCLSHETVMISPPDHVDVYSPRLEEVSEA